MTFNIAIIDSNVLTGIALKQFLQDIIPMAEIEVLQSFDQLQGQEFAHYFVSSRIYFEHTQFFRQQPMKTIVLVNGDMSIAGVRTLNVCQTEKDLAHDILSLHGQGHGAHGVHQGHQPMMQPSVQKESLLSARESEVAILLCKGYINKEIADQLNISVTTVISHRKNIMEKLHARSLADIIIYAVMNGLVSVENL